MGWFWQKSDRHVVQAVEEIAEILTETRKYVRQAYEQQKKELEAAFEDVAERLQGVSEQLAKRERQLDGKLTELAGEIRGASLNGSRLTKRVRQLEDDFYEDEPEEDDEDVTEEEEEEPTDQAGGLSPEEMRERQRLAVGRGEPASVGMRRR